MSPLSSLRVSLATGLVALTAFLSCSRSEREGSPVLGSAGSSLAPSQGDTTPAVGTAEAATSETAASERRQDRALADAEFVAWIKDASEEGEYFFSDNVISNETSYLQPAVLLKQWLQPGGAYLGVGPEQNFTYIALSRPALAFIVDLRRDNLLEQLLYKALFEAAETRTHFLCLLLGRPWSQASDPGSEASITAVLDSVKNVQPSQAAFDDANGLVRARLLRLGIGAESKDWKRVKRFHRVFFEGQLALRFSLHEATIHQYPTLSELLSATDPAGRSGGFLATEGDFRFVQRLQRQNRVVPVVGDFAGRHALSRVAQLLNREQLEVSLFYTSNVEQYLFEGDTWARWVRNLEDLPTNERSLLLRVHLEQGRPHPMQLAGHRSTTVAQRFEQFFEHQARRPYKSHWQVATEDLFVVAAE